MNSKHGEFNFELRALDLHAVIMTSELEIVRSELFQLNLITKFISIAPSLIISHLCFQGSEISSNYTEKIEVDGTPRMKLDFFLFLGEII